MKTVEELEIMIEQLSARVAALEVGKTAKAKKNKSAEWLPTLCQAVKKNGMEGKQWTTVEIAAACLSSGVAIPGHRPESTSYVAAGVLGWIFRKAFGPYGHKLEVGQDTIHRVSTQEAKKDGGTYTQHRYIFNQRLDA